MAIISCGHAHDNLLFTATKNQLQVTNLKTLETKLICTLDYDISNITTHLSGKRIIAYSDTQISIILLPFYSFSTDTLVHSCALKTIQLGSNYYSQNHILKCAFHPLSDSHVLVLSADNILRLFNISVDIEEPEQLYNFNHIYPLSTKTFSLKHNLQANKKGMFTSDPNDLITFKIGQGPGWNLFTIYGLLTNGDIYTLCPVMPLNIQYSLSHLQHLKNPYIPEINHTDATSKLHHWTSRWIQDFENQLSKDSLPSDLVNIKLPEFYKKIGISRQGPFLSSFLDDESRNATDFLIIPEKDFRFACIAFDNGTIDFCLLLDPAAPIWNLNLNVEDIPTSNLLLLERISLNIIDEDSFLKLKLSLTIDCKYNDTFYCYHDSGAHSISFQNWTTEISQCMLSKNPESLNFEKCSCDCKWIVNTGTMDSNEMDNVVFFATISDIFLGYGYALVTESSQMFFESLNIRTKTISPQKLSSTSSYPSILKSPCYSVPGEFIRKPVKMIGQSRLTYPEFVNEDSLLNFTKQVAQLGDGLKSVFEKAHLLQSRIDEQIHEQKVQLAILSSTRLENDQFETNLNEKLEKINSRQKKINMKADIILQILIDQTQPRLSIAEREWFEKLKKISVFIKGLQSTCAKLKKEKEKIKERSHIVEERSYLGSSQTKRINESLDKEYDIIMKLTKRVENMKEKMKIV